MITIKLLQNLNGMVRVTLNYFGLKLYYNKNEIMDEKNIYENIGEHMILFLDDNMEMILKYC